MQRYCVLQVEARGLQCYCILQGLWNLAKVSGKNVGINTFGIVLSMTCFFVARRPSRREKEARKRREKMLNRRCGPSCVMQNE